MAQDRYYLDTSSILDLDAYGLIKHLQKISIVVVPEIFDEILDRNLKRRLRRMLQDGSSQRRAAFVPGLDSLDRGERAIVRTMLCDHNRGWRRVYVSNDAGSQKFISTCPERICEARMDTSDLIIMLYKNGSVSTHDIRRILVAAKRRPNKTCREHLEHVLQPAA